MDELHMFDEVGVLLEGDATLGALIGLLGDDTDGVGLVMTGCEVHALELVLLKRSLGAVDCVTADTIVLAGGAVENGAPVVGGRSRRGRGVGVGRRRSAKGVGGGGGGAGGRREVGRRGGSGAAESLDESGKERVSDGDCAWRF
ncbi:hypothetical protein FGB62_6g40 [Gracilaria domingensis]|nr:hypothetical protein FGB62_6g40 [Gracilaria domingensis]